MLLARHKYKIVYRNQPADYFHTKGAALQVVKDKRREGETPLLCERAETNGGEWVTWATKIQ